MTFGKPYGMLEAGEDVGNLVSTSTRGLEYYAPVCLSLCVVAIAVRLTRFRSLSFPA